VTGEVNVYVDTESLADEPLHDLVVRHTVQTRDRAQHRRRRVLDLAALQA
jgi:hypothetical protein